jgi:hypothetical protein
MSGSNDPTLIAALAGIRSQNRRPSAQQRLAEQMMASLNNNTPVYGTGPTLARAGSGMMAGLMAALTDRQEREREDQQIQQAQDRADKRRLLDGQALAGIAGMGGAPQPQQEAPQAMPMAQPVSMPRSAAPMPEGDDTGVAASTARYNAMPGRPPVGASYREPEWAAGLPPANGRINPLPLEGGASPASAPPAAQPTGGVTLDTINQVSRLAANGNAQAAAVLPQLRWQFEQSQRNVRPPMAVSPGQTVIDPTTGRPIFSAPERPQAPDETARLFAAAGIDPASEEGRRLARAMLERRGMPPQNNINVDNRPERALLQADVDTIKTMNEAANQMFGTRELFSRARQALAAAPEGQGAQFAPFIGQVGRSLGIDIPGTTEAEVLQSITARLAPAQRIAGSGATSDRDINLFLQAVPRLGRTREGNLQILEMGERVADRTLEIARLWRQHAGSPDLIDIINKLPPIFSDEERRALTEPGGVRPSAPLQAAPQPGGVAGPGGMTLQPPPAAQPMPRISSPADAMRLPPGTRFIDPNGVTREVPRR